jgi:hypothetical protein
MEDWSGLWPGRSTPLGKSPRYPLTMRLDEPRAELEENVVNIWDVFADSILRIDLSRAIAHLYVRI